MNAEKKKPVSGEGQTGFKNTYAANSNPVRQLLQAPVCGRPVRGITERGGLLPDYTQREIVLRLLSCNPVTTLTLEEEHNILNPPAVIFELRKIYKIKTTRVYQLDSSGFEHNVAQYALQGLKPQSISGMSSPTCKMLRRMRRRPLINKEVKR